MSLRCSGCFSTLCGCVVFEVGARVLLGFLSILAHFSMVAMLVSFGY